MRGSKLGLEVPLLIALSFIICHPVFPQSQRVNNSKEPTAKPERTQHGGSHELKN